MSSRRLLKAAAAVREVVGLSILADLKDPRIRDVTVTHVEISPDMRHAKVYVSVMGNETQQQLSLRGLQSAAGFLQSKIAERIETRYTPRLMFVLDQGVKKSIEMARILKQVLPLGEGDAGQIATSNEETEARDLSDAADDVTNENEENESQDKRRPQ
jgi:ribosome-binding factor A